MRWIAFIAMGVLAACQTSEPAPNFNLEGSEWSYETPKDRYVQFRQDGLVTGRAGCNQFNGTYVQAADRIEIDLDSVTLMLCPAPIMELEDAFLEMLKSARRTEASHLTLVLMTESGEELATLRRQDWD